MLAPESPAQRLVARLAQQHGKGKALTILAHKLARAVYHMLRREQAFEAAKFFAPAARGERAVRPAIAGGAGGEGHDAARSGPTRHDREGGRYVDPPEISRRGSGPRVHERDGASTTQPAGCVAERREVET